MSAAFSAENGKEIGPPAADRILLIDIWGASS
jgi:hypothetical protein